MKRMIALALAIVLCLGLFPAAQARPAREPQASTDPTASLLYPEFQDEVAPSSAPTNTYEPNANTYVSVDTAVEQLEAAMEKRQEVINLYIKSPEYLLLDDLFSLVGKHTGSPTRGDYIRFCYKSCKRSISYKYHETSSGSYYNIDIKLTMNYYHNAAQEKELTARINEVLKSLKVESFPDEYHKTRAIYDYITEHVTYDWDSPSNYLLQYSPYAALIEGKAVCQGISLLLYRMLLQAGVDNRIITGQRGILGHAWNIVQIGEWYYHADATNDLGQEDYQNFLLCDDSMTSYIRDSEYTTLKFYLYYPIGHEDHVPVHCYEGQPWVVIRKASCKYDGSQIRYCRYCSGSEEEILPALGHDRQYTHYVPPTCLKWGYAVYTCIRCPDTMEIQCEEPLQHDYNLIIERHPSEGSKGYMMAICIYCNDTAGFTSACSTPHKHVCDTTYQVAPTCTRRGYTASCCTAVPDCRAELRYDYVMAPGHHWIGSYCRNCSSTRQLPFRDVPYDVFYRDPVFWALDNNITSGTAQYYFSPDAPCQRAQVVTFLWRAAGQPEPTITTNPFVDVKEQDYYYKAVLWAAEKGITSGLDQTHFGPFETCNRAQVVTFLHRTMGNHVPSNTTHPFTDVDPSAFYYIPMLWAVENGITSGLSATTFGPNAVCNRAQIVTFLYRAYS